MKAKKFFIDYLPMAMTAILIITFAVWKEQTFLKTLPTLVTLVVQILLARANRFGFLLGGINACVYGLAYLSEGLYFSVISAIGISAPIQLYSFIVWSKKKSDSNNNTAELRRLGFKGFAAVILITIAAWAACYFGLGRFFSGAAYPSFDSFHFAIGLVVSVLAAQRYVESQHINIIPCATSIVMWTLICLSNPSNINMLIISFYNLFMVSKAAIAWGREYRSQKNEAKIEKNI